MSPIRTRQVPSTSYSQIPVPSEPSCSNIQHEHSGKRQKLPTKRKYKDKTQKQEPKSKKSNQYLLKPKVPTFIYNIPWIPPTPEARTDLYLLHYRKLLGSRRESSILNTMLTPSDTEKIFSCRCIYNNYSSKRNIYIASKQPNHESPPNTEEQWQALFTSKLHNSSHQPEPKTTSKESACIRRLKHQKNSLKKNLSPEMQDLFEKLENSSITYTDYAILRRTVIGINDKKLFPARSAYFPGTRSCNSSKDATSKKLMNPAFQLAAKTFFTITPKKQGSAQLIAIEHTDKVQQFLDGSFLSLMDLEKAASCIASSLTTNRLKALVDNAVAIMEQNNILPITGNINDITKHHIQQRESISPIHTPSETEQSTNSVQQYGTKYGSNRLTLLTQTPMFPIKIVYTDWAPKTTKQRKSLLALQCSKLPSETAEQLTSALSNKLNQQEIENLVDNLETVRVYHRILHLYKQPQKKVSKKPVPEIWQKTFIDHKHDKINYSPKPIPVLQQYEFTKSKLIELLPKHLVSLFSKIESFSITYTEYSQLRAIFKHIKNEPARSYIKLFFPSISALNRDTKHYLSICTPESFAHAARAYFSVAPNKQRTLQLLTDEEKIYFKNMREGNFKSLQELEHAASMLMYKFSRTSFSYLLYNAVAIMEKSGVLPIEGNINDPSSNYKDNDAQETTVPYTSIQDTQDITTHKTQLESKIFLFSDDSNDSLQDTARAFTDNVLMEEPSTNPEDILQEEPLQGQPSTPLTTLQMIFDENIPSTSAESYRSTIHKTIDTDSSTQDTQDITTHKTQLESKIFLFSDDSNDSLQDTAKAFTDNVLMEEPTTNPEDILQEEPLQGQTSTPLTTLQMIFDENIPSTKSYRSTIHKTIDTDSSTQDTQSESEISIFSDNSNDSLQDIAQTFTANVLMEEPTIHPENMPREESSQSQSSTPLTTLQIIFDENIPSTSAESYRSTMYKIIDTDSSTQDTQSESEISISSDDSNDSLQDMTRIFTANVSIEEPTTHPEDMLQEESSQCSSESHTFNIHKIIETDASTQDTQSAISMFSDNFNDSLQDTTRTSITNVVIEEPTTTRYEDDINISSEEQPTSQYVPTIQHYVTSRSPSPSLMSSQHLQLETFYPSKSENFLSSADGSYSSQDQAKVLMAQLSMSQPTTTMEETLTVEPPSITTLQIIIEEESPVSIPDLVIEDIGCNCTITTYSDIRDDVIDLTDTTKEAASCPPPYGIVETIQEDYRSSMELIIDDESQASIPSLETYQDTTDHIEIPTTTYNEHISKDICIEPDIRDEVIDLTHITEEAASCPPPYGTIETTQEDSQSSMELIIDDESQTSIPSIEIYPDTTDHKETPTTTDNESTSEDTCTEISKRRTTRSMTHGATTTKPLERHSARSTSRTRSRKRRSARSTKITQAIITSLINRSYTHTNTHTPQISKKEMFMCYMNLMPTPIPIITPQIILEEGSPTSTPVPVIEDISDNCTIKTCSTHPEDILKEKATQCQSSTTLPIILEENIPSTSSASHISAIYKIIETDSSTQDTQSESEISLFSDDSNDTFQDITRTFITNLLMNEPTTHSEDINQEEDLPCQPSTPLTTLQTILSENTPSTSVELHMSTIQKTIDTDSSTQDSQAETQHKMQSEAEIFLFSDDYNDSLKDTTRTLITPLLMEAPTPHLKDIHQEETPILQTIFSENIQSISSESHIPAIHSVMTPLHMNQSLETTEDTDITMLEDFVDIIDIDEETYTPHIISTGSIQTIIDTDSICEEEQQTPEDQQSEETDNIYTRTTRSMTRGITHINSKQLERNSVRGSARTRGRKRRSAKSFKITKAIIANLTRNTSKLDTKERNQQPYTPSTEQAVFMNIFGLNTVNQ